jgi:hypothetical protein
MADAITKLTPGIENLRWLMDQPYWAHGEMSKGPEGKLKDQGVYKTRGYSPSFAVEQQSLKEMAAFGNLILNVS